MKLLLQYWTVGVFTVRLVFLHSSSMAQWNRLFTPASFGCDQMLVWLAKKKGKTLLSKKYFNAYLFQRLPCPSRNKMTGPWFGGKAETKCLAYTMKTSCIMLPLLVVSTTTSGTLSILLVVSTTTSILTVQRFAVVVSLVVSSVRCLTRSSASFSFVFDLSAWMRTGPQAPLVIPLATSRYSPLKKQANKENNNHQGMTIVLFTILSDPPPSNPNNQPILETYHPHGL